MVIEEDLRVRRTKKLLIEALMSLLQEMAFEKISVNDICERAMVHRATFYNHFSDKADLFNYALDELEEEMFESTIENGNFNSAKEMYLCLIVKVFDFIEENRKKFNLILKNNSEKIVLLIATTMKRSLRYLISKNKYTQEDEYAVPLNIIIDFFMGGITFIVLDWIQHDAYKKEELIKLFEIFIDEQLFKKE